MSELDENSIKALKVVELKAELQNRGLPVGGKKAELATRLKEAVALENAKAEPSPAAEPTPAPEPTPTAVEPTPTAVEAATEPTPTAVEPTPPAVEPTPPAVEPTPQATEPTPQATEPTPMDETTDTTTTAEPTPAAEPTTTTTPEESETKEPQQQEGEVEEGPPRKKARKMPKKKDRNKPDPPSEFWVKIPKIPSDVTEDDLRAAFKGCGGEMKSIELHYPEPEPTSQPEPTPKEPEPTPKEPEPEQKEPAAEGEEGAPAETSGDVEMTDASVKEGGGEEESTASSSVVVVELTESSPVAVEPTESSPVVVEPTESSSDVVEPTAPKDAEGDVEMNQNPDKAEAVEEETPPVKAEPAQPFALVSFTTAEARKNAVDLGEIVLKDTTSPVEIFYHKSEEVTLFLGSLPAGIDSKVLRTNVERIGGPIMDLRPKTGYAFATYPCLELAAAALEKFADEKIEGKTVNAEYSKKEEERHSRTLYIQNIAKKVTDEELKNHFDNPEEILKVHIPRYENKQAKGFAFVEFITVAGAVSAQRSKDQTVLQGTKIDVAVSKPPRRLRRGGRGGRFRGRGGFRGGPGGGRFRGGGGWGGGPGGGGGGGWGDSRSYGPRRGGGGWRSGGGGSSSGGGGGQVMALDTRTNRMVPLNMDQVRQVQQQQQRSWGQWGRYNGGGWSGRGRGRGGRYSPY